VSGGHDREFEYGTSPRVNVSTHSKKENNKTDLSRAGYVSGSIFRLGGDAYTSHVSGASGVVGDGGGSWLRGWSTAAAAEGRKEDDGDGWIKDGQRREAALLE
jgi:hypothetical protein